MENLPNTPPEKSDLNKEENRKPIMGVIERKPYTFEEFEKWKETFADREKLADKVCLKYKKGDVFNFSLEKIQLPEQSSPRYNVVLDGIEIGNCYIGTGEDGQDKILKSIVLNKNIRGKGFAKQLYILLNDYLEESEGSVLKQSYETSNGSNSVWLSLFNEGLAEVVPENSPEGYKIPWMKNDFLPKGTILYRFKK